MVQWWRDISVSKKLYTVVGVMGLLIATELFTLIFAMDILSSVRSFVGGEGIWSKAQKNAIYNLHRYAQTSEPQYWEAFQEDLEISRGDHEARLEMSKKDFNFSVVRAGFIRGGNHPDDIPGLVHLIRRFYWTPYISRALEVWRQADEMILQIQGEGQKLRREVLKPPGQRQNINAIMLSIDQINGRLTQVEIAFSNVLGEGSRWLERVLMFILMCAVLTVESTGLFLTIRFSRTLSRGLQDLAESAREVGKGNFSAKVIVQSRDELGQLSEAVNKMSEDLAKSVGARHQAENANQVKSMFLANMSHEIRTPLGVMLGLTEILKERDLSWEDHARYVETIERTGKSLVHIINDILDLSKVEAGHLQVEAETFRLTEFMNELGAMLSVRATKVGCDLIFSPNGPQAEFIRTDRVRLRQILVNVVNNALKFTNHGRVLLTYWSDGFDLFFEVTDTGAGISEADRKLLFQPFSRVRDSSAAGTEGTGLGLALSQELARALGGDLELVHSELGKGSTFRLHVRSGEPVREESAVTEILGPSISGVQESPASLLAGKKILVVEDSEDNQLLVRLLLTRQGIHVDFAENGQVGMERALKANYDAVLMDMQMPVMDGYKATEKLRENGFSKPIIALTAHAMKEDRERCLKVGCNDYLTKPINSNLLLKTLSKQFEMTPDPS